VNLGFPTTILDMEKIQVEIKVKGFYGYLLSTIKPDGSSLIDLLNDVRIFPAAWMDRNKRTFLNFSPAHPTDLTLFVPLTISRGRKSRRMMNDKR